MSDSEARIDALMGKMDLRDKVGQCLTLNFTGYTIADYQRRFIREFRCGGLRVTPHISGCSDDYTIRKLAPHVRPAEYTAVLRELQEMALERNGIPLHLVTDQEGDLSVDILRGGMQLFPSSMGLAATGDSALVKNAWRVVADQLRAHGISWVHSPVLDVNINPRNPEIGMRSFSDDPKVCAKYGVATMKGLLAGGVIPTGKHFPGRGDSVIDAHDDLDVLRVDRKRLDRVELAPYRALIKAGLPAIMTAHNAYPALDDTLTPASVSYRITTELLRNELGFNGVITTDAIGMSGLMKFAGGQWGATVMAIKAGADLVLIKEDEVTTARCFEALLAAVKNKEIGEARIDESVKRILRAKALVGVLDHPLPDPARTAKVLGRPKHAAVCREAFARGSIVVRDRDGLLPLKPDAKVLAVEPYIPIYHGKGNDAQYHSGMFAEWMRGHSDRVVGLELNSPATDEDLKRFEQKAAAADVIVFFNIFWRGSASNRPLIRQAVKTGKKVILATNDLYDGYFLPEVGTVLCTFGAVPGGTKMAADIVYGTAKPGGTWPLRQPGQADAVPEGEAVDHAVTGHFAKL